MTRFFSISTAACAAIILTTSAAAAAEDDPGPAWGVELSYEVRPLSAIGDAPDGSSGPLQAARADLSYAFSPHAEGFVTAGFGLADMATGLSQPGGSTSVSGRLGVGTRFLVPTETLLTPYGEVLVRVAAAQTTTANGSESEVFGVHASAGAGVRLAIVEGLAVSLGLSLVEVGWSRAWTRAVGLGGLGGVGGLNEDVELEPQETKSTGWSAWLKAQPTVGLRYAW